MSSLSPAIQLRYLARGGSRRIAVRRRTAKVGPNCSQAKAPVNHPPTGGWLSFWAPPRVQSLNPRRVGRSLASPGVVPRGQRVDPGQQIHSLTTLIRWALGVPAPTSARQPARFSDGPSSSLTGTPYAPRSVCSRPPHTPSWVTQHARSPAFGGSSVFSRHASSPRRVRRLPGQIRARSRSRGSSHRSIGRIGSSGPVPPRRFPFRTSPVHPEPPAHRPGGTRRSPGSGKSRFWIRPRRPRGSNACSWSRRSPPPVA